MKAVDANITTRNSAAKPVIQPSIAPLLLTPKEVSRITSIKPRTIRGYVSAGTFPKPRRVGGRAKFVYAEVVAWVKKLPVD